MTETPKSKQTLHLRYAARRIAAGQNLSQVASLFSVPESEMRALMQQEHFQAMVKHYRQWNERPAAEQMAERQALVLDALDCLVEDRNAGSVHWLAGKMGIFDQESRAAKPRHELDHLRWGPFDEIYAQLPKHLQEAYRAFDPDFEPLDPDFDEDDDLEVDDIELDDADLEHVDNLIRFPGVQSLNSAVDPKKTPSIEGVDTEFAVESDPVQ
ncbi:MAG: hypothetical protein AAFY56_15480, partial [Pseudomonadota bacterium]